MSKRSNKPLWLILSLIVLGVVVTFLAQMIIIDGKTDDSFRPDAPVEIS